MILSNIAADMISGTTDYYDQGGLGVGEETPKGSIYDDIQSTEGSIHDEMEALNLGTSSDPTVSGGSPKSITPDEGGPSLYDVVTDKFSTAGSTMGDILYKAYKDTMDPSEEAPVEVVEATPTDAPTQTDEALTEAYIPPQVDVIESMLTDFETSEGTTISSSVEGGVDTLPYGLKDVTDIDLADYTVDGVVDYRGAAKGLLKLRVGQLSSKYTKFNAMPRGLKKTLISTTWNQGMYGANGLSKGLNAAMELPKGKQVAAVKKALDSNLLDGFSANDPKDGKMRPMVGLMKRKAEDYNMAAAAYGFPTITTWTLKHDVVKEGGRTYREVGSYYAEDGSLIMKHRKQSNKHSKSDRTGSL